MSATTTTKTTATEPSPAPGHGSIGQALSQYWDKVRGGDVGSLPAVLGLVALVIVFTVLRPENFTNAFNFANLINQSAAVTLLAMGLVFVLLLGEIDLSAGFTAGTSAAVMAVVLTNQGRPWWIALFVCLAVGAFIGLVIGMLVARLGIPSFVVTLAFYLALQGVMLVVIGDGGTIPIQDDTILAVMNSNLPVWLGWALFILSVMAYGGVTYVRIMSRRKLGLITEGLSVWAARVVSMVVLLGVATFYLSLERRRVDVAPSLRGIPIVVVVFGVLLVALTFLLQRTSFGRHVYAVGGNAEAARRAGINVSRIKIACFMMCSTLAGLGGIALASRDNSVSPSTGGNQTLLYAVGAAVIGGTSLFGGKGKIKDAIIGGLVVGVIANGMGLLQQSSGVQFIVTGLVLLVAASVDAISRRRSAAG